MSTLWDALHAVACSEPDLPCIIVPAQVSRHYHPDGLEWTYGQVAAMTQQLVDQYAARGWGRGHRVALLLENRPELMLHFLALNALGAWLIPINPDYRQDDLLNLFCHAEPDLVVSIQDRCSLLEQVGRAMGKTAPAVVPQQEFSKTLPAPRRAAMTGTPTLESGAVLLYTSGTTGMPKGCLIGNDYLYFAGKRYTQAGGTMTLRPGAERLYNPLPLFYANSLTIANPAMILSRNAMIFPDRFHPELWWKELVQTKATIMHYLGIIPPLLLAKPVCPEERMHNVRFGVGAGIEPERKGEFETRFGIPLVEVWGMTEVGIAIATQHQVPICAPRSIGRPLAGVEAKVIGDDGRNVAIGETGELVLRREGPNPRSGFFAEYVKDADATEAAWLNGWFHTGDIVRSEADGSLSFVDRKKNMIRRSGQNIAAAEIEACLAAHPAIQQVVVLPVPDEMRQEEVLACIIAREKPSNPEELARQIVTFALQRLAYFKVPGWVTFVDSLPTTSTHKLQKAKIFQSSEDPRSRPDMIDLREVKRMAAAKRLKLQ
ncbi:AMP-binding protein [Cupriavidus numazuensis]|uniref:Long-chain-fatty-acid--CoA ligase n=1 Tax=Cupriavidus numazuensis TaxID=221992 RepID=A0ABN7QIG8_9BURK|nr:AMP-binding protein [Cupriavidus numazuensis]CAG2160738.1 Long-chain-fatty-acid--CoA ligase [Cupriavidus numazuensis]